MTKVTIKQTFIIFTLMILVIVTLAIVRVSLQINANNKDLYRLSRITEETGLTLPEGTRIIAIAAHTFSLFASENYEWLIESDTPLTSWIESNSMARVDDGISWAHIENFGEIAQIARSQDKKLALDSVWKILIAEETSYLFLAEGKKVAKLSTFRP
ncbi:hypothetical protein OAB00_00595 [Akkermansiaceae bacterium]|nr:hypothetical protein [Akkermansiaceae bacterium]